MLHYIKSLIKKHFIENQSIPDLENSLLQLKKMGVKPEVFFDIGAYEGGFSKLFFNVWKNTKGFCFEGNPRQLDKLHHNLKDFSEKLSIFSCLLGNNNIENVTFKLAETASSVLDEHFDQDFTTVEVPMFRLDKLIDEGKIPIPSFVKIDTQGYEFEILQGLGKYIDKVDYFLIETNFIDIHKNVHLVADIVNLLNTHNFVMYDITEIHRRPLDRAIFQVDFIFVKENSFLRNDKRWKQ